MAEGLRLTAAEGSFSRMASMAAKDAVPAPKADKCRVRRSRSFFTGGFLIES